MKLDKAINDVQDAEADLARQLRVVGERHAVEQDLYHLSHTLARQRADHLERLAPFAQHYGASQGTAEPESPPLLKAVRHKSSELLGRFELSGMLLPRDLRNLYLTAQHAEIAWTILIQTALAARDRELIQTAGTATSTSRHKPNGCAPESSNPHPRSSQLYNSSPTPAG